MEPMIGPEAFFFMAWREVVQGDAAILHLGFNDKIIWEKKTKEWGGSWTGRFRNPGFGIAIVVTDFTVIRTELETVASRTYHEKLG